MSSKVNKLKNPTLKGYCLNWKNIRCNEYPQEDYPVVVTKTRGQAKTEILDRIRYDDLYDDFGEELSFLNIRILRKKSLDTFLFEGEIKPRYLIEDIQAKRKRDAEFLKLIDDNPKGFAYILKGGYYYCSNYCGYSEYTSSAGVYTIQDAVRECMGCSVSDYIRPILINVEEHNKMIQEKIDSLKTKLIEVVKP